ncbi:AtpZ/AtpI family protein [Arenibaculum pallidiluteum]|uniref:AtpZ/AtpI family protein n=1 Tax=Arenibaculum pallidiluteum TaxID=2812559 RepID=UPI001A96FE96|nr:AtpZ/AtpI family protein [Arenibaculum pallidiluteum]
MSDDRPPSLDDLDARLRKARERSAPPVEAQARDGVPHSAFGIAFRIGIELVAALVVGLAIGLLFDRWLETGPWGLLAGLLLGFGAGIMNVYRAVNGLGMAVGYRREPGQGNGPEA